MNFGLFMFDTIYLAYTYNWNVCLSYVNHCHCFVVILQSVRIYCE